MQNYRTNLNEYKWESFYQEFQEESPRAAVILAGAFLDTLLTDLLTSFMIENDRAVDELLGKTKNFEDTVTSSFAAKIKISYCLGIISNIEYHDLNRIKNIRNRFSHEIHGYSFENNDIIKNCNELEIPKKFLEIIPEILNTCQGKFIFTVSQLLMRLGIRILEVQKERRVTRKNEPFI